jgi:ADP-Ribosyltransferase in polyvalent proteins
MSSLTHCIRTHKFSADDTAELRAFISAANGNEKAGLQKYMSVLNEDMKSVRDQLTAAGYDVGIKKEFLQAVPKTETPEFKKWFGDSKVVDANGDPLVVYHGTTAGDFTAFDSSLAGKNFASDKNAGHFFINNPTEAYGHDIDGGRIIPAYLKLENPQIIHANDDDPAQIWYTNNSAYINRQNTLGHDGTIVTSNHGTTMYVVRHPTQIKSIFNRGTFDPNDPRILHQGARGSIELPMDGQGAAVINLFKGNNLSTFLHESGHYFLHILKQVADGGMASPDIRAMHATVQSWWHENAKDVAKDASKATGLPITELDVISHIDNGTTGDALKDNAIETGKHEQFARGFEAYVMEGKAPTIELRSAFERFRSWLLNVYKNLVGLDVQVSDELRGVFDRMLATDTELQKSRADVFDQMIFGDAAQAGLSEKDFYALQKLHIESKDEAAQKLLRKTMKPLAERRNEAYKEELKAAAEEVTARINDAPVYRLIELLGNDKWLGSERPAEIPQELRMDKAALVEQYGEGIVRTLPRASKALYAEKDGVHPDVVAGLFGFDSTDQMIKMLEKAPKREDAIKAEIEKTMQERHGDALRDGSVEGDAIDAIHNDKRSQFLAAELAQLKTLAGDATPSISWQQAKELARVSLNETKVRDAIKPERFLAAERRAASDVASIMRAVGRDRLRANARKSNVGVTVREVLAKESPKALEKTNAAIGDANVSIDKANKTIADAVKSAQARLLNHALYTESRKILAEVEKAERYVSRLSKAVRKARSDPKNSGIAGDYVDALEELLGRYDFSKLSGAAEDRKGMLLAYVERMKADGRENELAIPDEVLNDAAHVPYRLLNMTRLRAVIDTMKNVEHTARMKRSLLDAQRKRDFDDVRSKVLAAFEANVSKANIDRARSGRSKSKDMVSKYINLVKNTDTILREIDGFNDAGETYENVKADIDKAASQAVLMREEAANKFDELYSVYTREEQRQMGALIDVPELGTQLRKWDLISIAQHMGNEDNIQRLTDPRSPKALTKAGVNEALKRLDERDWKFVQSTWDMLDSYWPEIEARELRTTGIAPEKVKATEVVTAHGVFRGGYFPIKYDADLGPAARNMELTEISAAMQAGKFAKAQTRNGHTKERGVSASGAVVIDIGVMHQHVNQVIHDLAFSEVVNNSWKLLKDNQVQKAFIEHGMKNELDTLQTWLMDVAAGRINSSDVVMIGMRKLKTGFTVSRLAFNLKTVLMQPLGIAQSMVVVGKKNFALGVNDMFRFEGGINGAAKAVMKKSVFMRERQTTFNKDIYDMLGNQKNGPTEGAVKDFIREKMAPYGFYLMTKSQFYCADLPTWFAGYRKSLDAGMSEDAAVAAADRIVSRSQGSGIFSDHSSIERGSTSISSRQHDVTRLFTTLGSYMFAKFNVAYERTKRTEFSDPKAAFAWACDMALLYTLEAVVVAAIAGRTPGGDQEQKDDTWAKFLARETTLNIAGSLPFARDLAASYQGFNGGGAYGSVMDIISTPINRSLSGKEDHTLIKNMVDAGGLFLFYPSVQANRFFEAAYQQSNSPLDYMIGKH